MKNSFILLLLLLICSSQFVQAQQKINYYPDSIRIELPNHYAMVVFEMRAYQKDQYLLKNFPALFKTLMDYVQKSTPSDFSKTDPHHIDIKIVSDGHQKIKTIVNVSGDAKLNITISKVDKPQTNVIVKESQIVELLPPGWEVRIISEQYKIKVYAESFQGLMDITQADFSEASSTLASDPGMKNIGRKSIQARMKLLDYKIDQRTVHYKHPTDQIFITANAGIGLFRDKLYPELSLKFGLAFNDHFNRQNIRASFIYNNLFMAEKSSEGGYRNFNNSFLSIAFERNFNPKDDHAHWSGFGAGLLVQKKGDYFTGKTAKFFITHELSSRFSVVPEFYLTDDFKKFTFGLKLNYSF